VGAFAGLADAYQRYRVPYPDAVFDWIAREYGLDGRGRLLDVGCGTGYVCVPLSRWFVDVVAVDPEPDMLRVAAEAARDRGVDNVRFLPFRAEDVPPSLAPLRLVTFGNSFHWTDRAAVARALFPMIEPGGGLVALASSTVAVGAKPWKTALLETVEAWLGPEARRRLSSGRQPGAPSHRDVLRETPFGEPRAVEVDVRHTWTSEALVGLLHSSSLQLRERLGDRMERFEHDLEERLVRAAPDGDLVDDIAFTIVAARRPA
jgi:SAM-dependent methyltransferase